MRSFWPIFKRELFAFFVTPLAWVLIFVFLLVQGMHFFLLVDHFATQGQALSDQTPVQAFFGNTVLLYLVLFLLIPPMTMRLFAEERRSGTIESLMTAPVSSAGVVLSKYAAVLTTYAAMWLPTVLYLVILGQTGDLDWHVAGSAYLGAFLVGAGYLSLGLMMSAITTSQFLALVMTALVILALFILGVGEFVTREGTTMYDICAHVSVWAHMNDFASGIVDSRRLAFYGALIVVPLFITVRAVDAWRWGTTVTFKRFRPILDAGQTSQLVSIVLALVLAVLGNVVVGRRFSRWDWTKNQRYSLTPATAQTLRDLNETVQVWVLLGSADPLEQSVKQLIVAYQAVTSRLDVHYVDPDRDTVALEDLRKRFKIETGRTEEGHVVSDAIVVVAQRDKHWFLTAADMVEISGGDDTHVKPKEERALTGAIRSVLGSERVKLCFTSGHGEMNPQELGDRGVGLLRDVLEKDNFEVAIVDTGVPGAAKLFEPCGVVIVAGLRGAFTNDEAERLRTYLLGGGNLLLATSPIPGEGETGLLSPNLGRVLAPFGIALDEDLVIEGDADLAFPATGGIRWVAEAQKHAVTSALVRGEEKKDVPRISFHFARSMHHSNETGSANAADLVQTSKASFGIVSIAGAADWKDAPQKGNADLAGPLVVAMAAERPKLAPSAPHGPRVVVLGSASPLTTTSFREPTPLRGGALLVESAISWLASKPQVLDVPDRPAVAAGLRITDDDRSAIRRYVLFFMPGTVAVLGLLIAYWRRRTEGSEVKPVPPPRKKKARAKGAGAKGKAPEPPKDDTPKDEETA